ncbi:hypothetical protein GH714_013690 [Hevea brasiliensis]|uniref:Dof zinc finger protein n=1 Tax=Hevea brasiliensis TaxID=3981 RepID=A0A6A6K5Z5_HEVBR|nr:hypothetical protein GH714_013690 [Hevea brasiliensis]
MDSDVRERDRGSRDGQGLGNLSLAQRLDGDKVGLPDKRLISSCLFCCPAESENSGTGVWSSDKSRVPGGTRGQIYKEEKMIQELLGGARLIGGERKISITGTILEGTPSTSPSLSPSSSTTTTSITTTATTTATAGNSTSSTSENLRCPRCDSSNTKFCYYNNYNLTQPRHFCKTCRRYWTKGGALRNVPIGGGCRKNKSTTVSTLVGKSSTSKMKTVASEIGRSCFGNGFDHELPSSPIMWASPQNSHLLTLLRATHNPNPNPSTLSNSLAVKEEGCMIGTHMISEPTVATGALNARTLGLDLLPKSLLWALIFGKTANTKLNSTNKLDS